MPIGKVMPIINICNYMLNNDKSQSSFKIEKKSTEDLQFKMA